MIKVRIKKQSSYPVSTPKLKEILRSFFVKNGIVSDADVSVAIVGENKMLDIGQKFLHDKKLHSVLSFTEEEAKKKFVLPPDNVIRLGEIIICYPEVVRDAKAEGKLIDEKIEELAEHAAMHLMGIHHSE